MDRNFTGSALSTTTIKNRVTGALIPQADVISTSNIILSSGKSSVNTGKFTPGEYRVNSYLIYEESAKGSDQVLIDSASDSYYDYQTILSGSWPLIVNAKTKTKLPSYTANIGNYPQRVILKAYGKIGASGVGGGEALGEIHQTISLLKHPFKNARDFFFSNQVGKVGLLQKLQHFATTGVWLGRKGKLYGAEAAKAAAGGWLEFRYGLMPLIYTIEDIVKLVNAKALKADPKRIRRKRAKVLSKVETTLSSFPATIGRTAMTIQPKLVDKFTHRAVVHYRLLELPDIWEQIGLSPKHLPETAWELTRLSFVLDWWLDLGSWIEGWRGFLDPKVQILGNTVSTKMERKVTSDVTTWYSGFTTQKTPRGDSGSEFTVKYYNRNIHQHLPTLPQWKPEYNSPKHVVDALALILQPITALILRSKTTKR